MVCRRSEVKIRTGRGMAKSNNFAKHEVEGSARKPEVCEGKEGPPLRRPLSLPSTCSMSASALYILGCYIVDIPLNAHRSLHH